MLLNLVSCVVFCRSLFVLLSFSFWPWYGLSFNLWLWLALWYLQTFLASFTLYIYWALFNLKGGGYGFLFHSKKFFRTTQELEYLFFLSREAQIFFPEFNIRLYKTKTLNQIIFFFLHQNQNILFSNIGNQNIFLEKNHNPPPFKLNGRSVRENNT
jgi:hypothetical protein